MRPRRWCVDSQPLTRPAHSRAALLFVRHPHAENLFICEHARRRPSRLSTRIPGGTSLHFRCFAYRIHGEC